MPPVWASSTAVAACAVGVLAQTVSGAVATTAAVMQTSEDQRAKRTERAEVGFMKR